jgi:hypothetical protein
VSAGDILALLMHLLPKVNSIGENTEGSFDSLRFTRLSIGRFYSMTSKALSGVFTLKFSNTSTE